MKNEKILTFIQQVKAAFASRRSGMHRARYHLPYIKQLEEDEVALADVSESIKKLDDSQGKTFAEKALSFLIDIVVPIFSRWMERNKLITAPDNANVKGHLIANNEYQALKEDFHALLVEVNESSGEPLFVVEGDKKPSIAIVEQYKKTKNNNAEVSRPEVATITSHVASTTLKAQAY